MSFPGVRLTGERGPFHECRVVVPLVVVSVQVELGSETRGLGPIQLPRRETLKTRILCNQSGGGLHLRHTTMRAHEPHPHASRAGERGLEVALLFSSHVTSPYLVVAFLVSSKSPFQDYSKSEVRKGQK